MRVGDGPASPTIEDAISSLCRATDERDPLQTRRAIRDAGRTYAQEATRRPAQRTMDACAPWSRVHVPLPSGPGIDGYDPSDTSDEAGL